MSAIKEQVRQIKLTDLQRNHHILVTVKYIIQVCTNWRNKNSEGWSLIQLIASESVLFISLSFILSFFQTLVPYFVISYIGFWFFLGKTNQIISHYVNVTLPTTTLALLFTSAKRKKVYFETNIANFNSGSSILSIVKDSILLTGTTSRGKEKLKSINNFHKKQNLFAVLCLDEY